MDRFRAEMKEWCEAPEEKGGGGWNPSNMIKGRGDSVTDSQNNDVPDDEVILVKSEQDKKKKSRA